MQLPRSGHRTVGFNVAAAGSRANSALDATNPDRSRPCVNIDVALAGEIAPGPETSTETATSTSLA